LSRDSQIPYFRVDYSAAWFPCSKTGSTPGHSVSM
jgi:hypothetical protein